ncbi:MAG TPA: SpoIIE family protein phosphatase [Flavobacteriales bacterium]|nr:SpoIIE family protein phosphatase [Flavobacteriales bacterium]
MRKTTILRQLLLNITIPVVLVLLLFSYTNYRYNKAELEERVQQHFDQITAEVKDLVALHDYAMKVNEKHFEARMRELSATLVKKFEKLDPRTTDLYKLSLDMGLDTNTESIYFIDTNGVIVNTTFHKDLHLDFYKRSDGYREYFEKIWAKNMYVSDRFSTEQVTGKIRKWSFEPTRDKLYLLELGFLSPEAKNMIDMLHSKVEQISKKDPDIHEVHIFMQVKGEKFHGIKDTVIQQKMQEVLLSRKNQRVITEEENRTVYEDLIGLPANLDETSMFSGIVLYIKSDDTRERQLLNTSIRRFGIMAVVAILVLLLIITFRARTITRPIKRLSDKTAVISSGHLEERIEVEGRNEIAQLSRNFNKMVEQLQESYETLEQKVKDRTAEVEMQKHIIEEKQKEVMDSINYARRIQFTLLANEQVMKENLPQHFVLFQPKDIVSGDFYWATKRARGQRSKVNNSAPEGSLADFYLAVCDSTGHGVPGAFMSLLNISFLNEAINEKNIMDPHLVLNHVRERLIQNMEGGKDGMDATLVRFSDGKITYASANNRPVLIRKGEIIELAADKMPVGKGEKNDSFTLHEIVAQKDDLLCFYTDGYADQFGGPKEKKFKYANLQKLLVDNAYLEMRELRNKLKEEFDNWKGELEQVDDVCVIGIRI